MTLRELLLKVSDGQFERHLGNSAKNRAVDAVRKQKHRASSKQ